MHVYKPADLPVPPVTIPGLREIPVGSEIKVFGKTYRVVKNSDSGLNSGMIGLRGLRGAFCSLIEKPRGGWYFTSNLTSRNISLGDISF